MKEKKHNILDILYRYSRLTWLGLYGALYNEDKQIETEELHRLCKELRDEGLLETSKSSNITFYTLTVKGQMKQSLKK